MRSAEDSRRNSMSSILNMMTGLPTSRNDAVLPSQQPSTPTKLTNVCNDTALPCRARRQPQSTSMSRHDTRPTHLPDAKRTSACHNKRCRWRKGTRFAIVLALLLVYSSSMIRADDSGGNDGNDAVEAADDDSAKDYYYAAKEDDAVADNDDYETYEEPTTDDAVAASSSTSYASWPTYRDDDDDDEVSSIMEEWYMVLIISLLFGFFLTLFGALVGYFSIKEDELMRRYRDCGDLVQGDVVAAEFLRGHRVWDRTQGRYCDLMSGYLVIVEYSRVISENYTVRVKKRLKTRESDLKKRDEEKPMGFLNIGVEGSMIDTCMTYESLDSRAEAAKTTEKETNAQNVQDTTGDGIMRMYGKNQRSETSDSGPIVGLVMNHSRSTAPPGPDTLELYVLPEFPKSGYPRNQAERNCSPLHRLSTALLILFDLCLAAFCTKYAIMDCVMNIEDAHDRMLGWYTISIFLLLLLLEVPIIHFCLSGWIDDALQDEHLMSGDFISDHFDDSSLSSGSDPCLLQTRPATGLSTMSISNELS